MRERERARARARAREGDGEREIERERETERAREREKACPCATKPTLAWTECKGYRFDSKIITLVGAIFDLVSFHYRSC